MRIPTLSRSRSMAAASRAYTYLYIQYRSARARGDSHRRHLHLLSPPSLLLLLLSPRAYPAPSGWRHAQDTSGVKLPRSIRVYTHTHIHSTGARSPALFLSCMCSARCSSFASRLSRARASAFFSVARVWRRVCVYILVALFVSFSRRDRERTVE